MMKIRVLVQTVVLAGLALTGCGNGSPMSGPGGMGGGMGQGMMGSRSEYHYRPLTCSAPSGLAAQTVRVTLADMGMTRMMGGIASMDAHMRLIASPTTVSAGRVSLVAFNMGWRTHELVILPLTDGAIVGQRAPAADGKVAEAGSLGEASKSCSAGTGEGIRSGTTGWTTVTLAPGRYELICNLRNHYADGMHQELLVV
jgi:uncharacterized cupredoxin-like copper-binding protein